MKCGIDGCTDNHHKLLHDVQSLRSKPPPVHNPAAINPMATAFSPRANSGQMSTQNMSSASEETPGQEIHHTACYGHQPKKSLLQVLPVIVHGKDGQQTEVLAMLDSGCDCTLISAAKAQELGLVSNQESSQKVTITGVNGTNTVESITINQPIILAARLPIALRAPLGWVAVNCLPSTAKSHNLSAFRARVETDENKELINVIESSTSVDLLSIKDNRTVTQSKEDERALRMMKATTHKSPNKDAYVSPLLWKEKDPKLPDNIEGAMKRFSFSGEEARERPTTERTISALN